MRFRLDRRTFPLMVAPAEPQESAPRRARPRPLPGALALTAVTALAALATAACAGRAPHDETAPPFTTLREDPPPPRDLPPRDPGPPVVWAQALTPLAFRDIKTGEHREVRLYADDGTIDETQAQRLDQLLHDPDAAGPDTLNRRLLQLVVKVAHHFHAPEVIVVSSFRESRRKGSRHRTGEAMDFILPGTPSPTLAALLRTYPRVGVGVYTHRRTQFVHLDVRAESYHWLDASPPGRVWRERPLPDRGAPVRDAAYRPEQDLP